MRALAEQSISLVLLQTVCVTTTILFPSPSRTSQVVAAPLRRIDEASVESSSSKKKKKKEKEKEKKEEEEGIARKDCPELKGNLLFGNHQSTRTSSTPQLESHSRTSDHRLTKRSNRRTYIHIYIENDHTLCFTAQLRNLTPIQSSISATREKSLDLLDHRSRSTTIAAVAAITRFTIKKKKKRTTDSPPKDSRPESSIAGNEHRIGIDADFGRSYVSFPFLSKGNEALERRIEGILAEGWRVLVVVAVVVSPRNTRRGH